MSKGTGDRTYRTVKTDIDLTVPVNKSSVKKDGSCFGERWDAKNSYCQICADSELCGILYAEKVEDMEAALERENAKFLDSQDWEALDQTSMRIWLGAKKRTVEEWADYIMETARTSDEDAVVEYIKRFVRSNAHISIKNGNIIIK